MTGGGGGKVLPISTRFQMKSNKLKKSVDVESATSRVQSSGALKLPSGEFRSVFRVARLLGLFPVSGLDSKDQTSELSFSPFSVRLAATVVLILFVLLLEGLNLLHALIYGDHEDRNKDVIDKYHEGAVASELTALLHYGTTVACVLLLINAARRFPETANLWEEAEGNTHRDSRVSLDTGNCTSALIVCIIVTSALLQTFLGTFGTVLINSDVDADSNGTSSSQVEQFFHKYVVGSHSFVATLLDDTFWSGFAVLIVSNYTVLVWVIVDLVLIFSSRNISNLATTINAEIELRPNDSQSLARLRHDHWLVCRVCEHLSGSLNGLYLSFYMSNLYFLWIHLMSLAYPPVSTTLYMLYQAWAVCRQLIRFCLVTYFSVRTSAQLSKPTRVLMGLSNTDQSSEEIKRFQDQSSKLYHGFKAGHLLRINEQTVSIVLLIFACALWMTILVEKQDQMTRISIGQQPQFNNGEAQAQGVSKQPKMNFEIHFPVAPSTEKKINFQILKFRSGQGKPKKNLDEKFPNETEVVTEEVVITTKKKEKYNIIQW